MPEMGEANPHGLFLSHQHGARLTPVIKRWLNKVTEGATNLGACAIGRYLTLTRCRLACVGVHLAVCSHPKGLHRGRRAELEVIRRARMRIRAKALERCTEEVISALPVRKEPKTVAEGGLPDLGKK